MADKKHMADKKRMEVAIVGGSLGGLFSGIILSRLGHNVTIFERLPAANVKDRGAGMAAATYLPPLIPALKELGTSGNPVIDFMKEHDRTKTKYYGDVQGIRAQVLNRDGSIKSSQTFEQGIMATTSWDLLHNILRANFDGNGEYIPAAPRKASDGKAEYVYNTQVTGLRESEDGMIEVDYAGHEGDKSKKFNLVIGADGASSTVRKLLLPEVERTYVGYVSWRGTVKADQLSASTAKCLADCLTQYYRQGQQVVHYVIPGREGRLSQDEELYNLVWYRNYAPGSPELAELLTDSSGIKHRFALPANAARTDLVEKQREIARQELPPQFSELFSKIKNPFITAVTDNLSPRSVFLDGKVILVGDAAAGNRPHTGTGSTQVALHALLLHRVFANDADLTIEDWGEKVCAWAKQVNGMSIQMGNLSQFGNHPMASNE